MKTRILLLAMMCWAGLQVGAQAPSGSAGTDSLYRKVQGFGIGLPQEKVYLHLDNTCYFLGDTIWYKGYVTRSDNGTLTDLSKILYVELLTPDGYPVERQQLEMPDGTAHGMFVLKDTLYAGYYELRAYTRWMLNFGQCEYPHQRVSEDLFYSKRMAKEFFRDYEKLYSRVFPVYDKPAQPGEYAKDMTLRPMRRYYKARKEHKPKLDLRFYPEGGNLVAGTDCRVALELNDEEGRHMEGMALDIVDRQGQTVASCRTDERGRATFRLSAVSEKAGYRARFGHEGYDYEERLPEVAPTGCALSVEQDDSTVTAVVQARGVDRPVAVHVMCRGVSHFYRPLEGTGGRWRVDIPRDSLPTGVNQLTVFDGEGRIYADRLFFVNHHDYPAVPLSVSGIRASYEPFDSITLHLQLDGAADSVAALSLAVRDRTTDEPSYDPTKPALVVDANEAYNLAADYGLVDIPYYYLEPQAVSTIMAFLFVGDMDRYRHYYVQARHDLQPWMPRKPSTPTLIPPENLFFFSDLQNRESWKTEEKLRSLSQLKDFSIYTDYVPREMGSWKYRQDNQPEVIVGFGFRPDGEYFPSCRDRRYLMRGYAVCEDFYSPDYSRRPLPATEDHRRTLLWMPDVRFGPDGKATVRLYNNSHRTALSIEAVGITEGGQYIQYRTQP